MAKQSAEQAVGGVVGRRSQSEGVLGKAGRDYGIHPAVAERFAAMERRLAELEWRLEAALTGPAEQSLHRPAELPQPMPMPQPELARFCSDSAPPLNGADDPRNADSVEPAENEEAHPAVPRKQVVVVTAGLLDQGDNCGTEESIYHAMFVFAHPAIGRMNSLILLGTWIVNLFLQAVFIYVIDTLLVAPAVDAEVLDGLLKFRLGVAHSVDFADKVTQRSMAAQVCNGETKLHMAGEQVAMYQDFAAFVDGGRSSVSLVLFVQFLWIATVMKDINSTVDIWRAIFRIKESRRTRLVLADLLDDDPSDPTRSQRSMAARRSTTNDSEEDAEYEGIVSLMKVVRMTRIWRGRKRFVLACVCLPKLAMAVMLYWVGARWLANTISFSDIILNGVALSFVLDFDEVLYAVFVPRRTKTLMGNMEPLPMPRSRPGQELSGLNACGKGVVVAIVLSLVYLVYVEPVFWKVHQGAAIVCSGDIDFIYTVNPATSMVHVARTAREDAYTDTEAIVAQVAQLDLQEHEGWAGYMDRAIFEAASSSFRRAVVVESDGAFGEIVQMSVWSMADAAASLPCRDLASGSSYEASLTTLRLLMNDSAISGCDDIPRELCASMGHKELRAICPQHCRCEDPMTSYVGFFGKASFGCPTQCETFKAARNEIAFRFEMARLAAARRLSNYGGPPSSVGGGYGGRPGGISGGSGGPPSGVGGGYPGGANESFGEVYGGGDDDGSGSFLSQALNESSDNSSELPGCQKGTSNSTDSMGYACSDFVYWGNSSRCGAYDDSDFTAAVSCCACNLKAPAPPPQPPLPLDSGPPNSLTTCDDVQEDEFAFPGGCADSLVEAQLDRDGNDCSAYVSSSQSCGLNDDEDFSAALDCCACGGGWQHVPSSVACWNEFTDTCWHLPAKALAWLFYMQGLFEFSLSKVGFRDSIANVVQRDYAGLALSEAQQASLVDHIMSGAMGKAIVSGSWELLPGLPHPRGFTGCDFMASYEITSLLNLELCADGDHTSIRFFCPRACDCDRSNGLSECPPGCVLFECIRDGSDSCAHVHPWFRGALA